MQSKVKVTSRSVTKRSHKATGFSSSPRSISLIFRRPQVGENPGDPRFSWLLFALLIALRCGFAVAVTQFSPLEAPRPDLDGKQAKKEYKQKAQAWRKTNQASMQKQKAQAWRKTNQAIMQEWQWKCAPIFIFSWNILFITATADCRLHFFMSIVLVESHPANYDWIRSPGKRHLVAPVLASFVETQSSFRWISQNNTQAYESQLKAWQFSSALSLSIPFHVHGYRSK